MMFDLSKAEKKLAERKDAYWARKVLYLAGFKVSMSLLPEGRVVDMMFKLVAKDVLDDMKERYPKRDQLELSCELISDCDVLLLEMAEEATKQYPEH